MHTILPDALGRQYVLTGLNFMWQTVWETRFRTLRELAIAAGKEAWSVEQNRRSFLPSPGQATRLKATGQNAALLPVEELIVWGRRLRLEEHHNRYAKVFEFRRGSVPGVRGWRGGSRTRPVRVQSERRDNAMVLWDEGEVPARAVRNGRHLPSSWDGRPRIVERSWKSQHSGRKSWDRPGI